MASGRLGAGVPGAAWLALTPRPPARPPADCLLMLAYRDRAERTQGLRERSSLTLEDICGLEPGLAYEGLAHTLAILCLSQATMLGFDSREAMCAWDARIRHALGEGECPPTWAASGPRPMAGVGGCPSGCRAGCCRSPWGPLSEGGSELGTRETPNRRGGPAVLSALPPGTKHSPSLCFPVCETGCFLRAVGGRNGQGSRSEACPP